MEFSQAFPLLSNPYPHSSEPWRTDSRSDLQIEPIIVRPFLTTPEETFPNHLHHFPDYAKINMDVFNDDESENYNEGN